MKNTPLTAEVISFPNNLNSGPPETIPREDSVFMANIVRKEPYWKGNQYWEEYQYGLEFIKISGEDRWKLDLLLSGRYYLEEMHAINDTYTDKETEF